ncbi:hypothetical protein HK104_003033 [Borealophlyctis nickersoniae]|nr:hypothetical protein HK104_003033 [Borealophlyctis nickersoniae]
MLGTSPPQYQPPRSRSPGDREVWRPERRTPSPNLYTQENQQRQEHPQYHFSLSQGEEREVWRGPRKPNSGHPLPPVPTEVLQHRRQSHDGTLSRQHEVQPYGVESPDAASVEQRRPRPTSLQVYPPDGRRATRQPYVEQWVNEQQSYADEEVDQPMRPHPEHGQQSNPYENQPLGPRGAGPSEHPSYVQQSQQYPPFHEQSEHNRSQIQQLQGQHDQLPHPQQSSQHFDPRMQYVAPHAQYAHSGALGPMMPQHPNWDPRLPPHSSMGNQPSAQYSMHAQPVPQIQEPSSSVGGYHGAYPPHMDRIHAASDVGAPTALQPPRIRRANSFDTLRPDPQGVFPPARLAKTPEPPHHSEPGVAKSPRPTFSAMTAPEPARSEIKTDGARSLGFEQTMALYRANAKKTNDPKIMFEFARFCIEDSAKAADQKTRDAMVDEGFALLKKLASGGHVDAIFLLGKSYYDDKKYDLAYPQFLLAAKRSHPPACHMVAKCAEHGQGTKKNNRIAVEFYTKAATAGHSPAMYRLGMAELTGELGLKRDPKKAVMWLKRGAAVADKRNPESLYQLSKIYEVGVPPLIVKDEGYARDVLEEAARLGHGPAQYKLGVCFEHGNKLGCQQDMRQAICWYTESARNGDRNAQFALAGWYLSGCPDALDRDPSQAFFWTQIAAEKKLPKAQYAMGYFLETGTACEKNLEVAFKWYRRAARQGDPKAIKRMEDEEKMSGSKEKKSSGFLGFFGSKK